MKKSVRILSMIVCFVLLFSIATPAFAYDGNNPPPSTRSVTKTIGSDRYILSASRNNDAYRYYEYLNEVDFNPQYQTSVVLSGSVNANTKTWTTSQAFNSLYRTNIESICNSVDITSEYGNRAESYYFEINYNYDRGTYTATLTCWHYAVDVTIQLGAGGTFTQAVSHVPVTNGDYVFVTG